VPTAVELVRLLAGAVAARSPMWQVQYIHQNTRVQLYVYVRSDRQARHTEQGFAVTSSSTPLGPGLLLYVIGAFVGFCSDDYARGVSRWGCGVRSRLCLNNAGRRAAGQAARTRPWPPDVLTHPQDWTHAPASPFRAPLELRTRFEP
jgi:hypothetical protein